jgi:hypothetical protein
VSIPAILAAKVGFELCKRFRCYSWFKQRNDRKFQTNILNTHIPARGSKGYPRVTCAKVRPGASIPTVAKEYTTSIGRTGISRRKLKPMKHARFVWKSAYPTVHHRARQLRHVLQRANSSECENPKVFTSEIVFSQRVCMPTGEYATTN